MIHKRIGSSTPVYCYIATTKARSNFALNTIGEGLSLFDARRNILQPRRLVSQPSYHNGQLVGFIYAQQLSWSGSGEYLITGCQTIAGGTPAAMAITLHRRTGTSLSPVWNTVRANSMNASGTTTSECGDVQISNNGQYFVACALTSRLESGVSKSEYRPRIFHNNGGSITEITNIGTPNEVATACAVSSDGAYAAFLLETSPFLRIKIRANSGASSTYSNLTVASAPSSGAVKDTARNGALAFSPDNTYLAVCPQKGTDSCIYKFNSSTQLYEKLASPFIGNLPSKFMNSSYWTNHVTWSADGNLLAIADSNNNSGSFEDGTTYIYERIGDTFTERASLPYGQRGNFDPSGQFYITGGSRNAQGGRIYKRGSTLTSWTAYGTVGLDNVGDWYEPTAQKFSPAII